MPTFSLEFALFVLGVIPCVCTHLCALTEPQRTISHFLYDSLPIPLRQVLSVRLESLFSQLSWKPASPRDPPVSALLRAK